MKKLFAVVLSFAMILALASCNNGAAPSGQTPSTPADPAVTDSAIGASPSSGSEVIVPVGGILSTTGPGANVGINQKNGTEYAIEVVNANGGLTIDGVTYKFKLVNYDDGTVAADAVSAAQRLIQEDKVTNMIFGCTSSTATLACLEILEAAKVPILTCTANPHITEDYIYGWRNKCDTEDQARLMTQYFLEQLDCKRLAVVANNDDWGRGGAEDISAAWTAAGGEVVSVQYIDPTHTDFTTEITNLKAAKPDFVFQISLKAAGAIMAKQYHEMNIDAYYATVDDVMCEYTNGDYLYWQDAGYTEDMKAVEEAIKAKGQECTIFALYGYDNFMLLFQAMEEAQTVYDADAIMAAMHASEGSKYTCMGKGFTWDENGQIRRDIYLIQQTSPDGDYVGVWCSPQTGEGYAPEAPKARRSTPRPAV